MTISFTIHGNQENPEGNPIPYHRSTQGAKWNPAHRRYLLWKDYVRQELHAQTEIDRSNRLDSHPFQNKARGSVSIRIDFADETHADPDNIVKGILDALFKTDKEIDVHTEHTCENPQGKVEVNIIIE